MRDGYTLGQNILSRQYFTQNFYQLPPGMRRVNRDLLLRVRISVLGRIEAVVLRYAEGSACPWTSSPL